MRRRVVITGLGAVTGLGVGAPALWEGLCAGRSAVRRLTRINPEGMRCRLGSEVKDLPTKDFVPRSYRKSLKVMARDTELAVVAAKLAVEDAGLATREHADATPGKATTYPGERFACHIGAGLISAETLELTTALSTAVNPGAAPDQLERTRGFTLRGWGSVTPEQGGEPGAMGGLNNLPPLWMLKYLPNMLACHVSIIHGTEGPSNTITVAEASGVLSVGESARVIERGAADAGIAGGAESKVNLMGILRLDLAGLLADTGDSESSPVRPYDPAAPGTVPGEAGGLLILESADSAQARGAKVYAEVAGFGAAHSLGKVIPPQDKSDGGRGLRLAIESALRDAGITAQEVDAIVPQASGTRVVDEAELAALRAVFGERLAQVPLVMTSTAIGNCSAGSGAVQTVVGAMCLKEQALPATSRTLSSPAGAGAGEASARAESLRYVLVCTGALGGQNAALVLRRWS